MDQHTKGKWHTGSNGHETIIYDEKGWAVANATVFHGRHNGPEEAKANARRIVACVNTLDSVSTEQLETAAKLGIEDVLSGNLFSARLKLQQECDELKAELKRINSKIPEAIQLSTEGHMESGVAMMAEQLTKAEGDAKREREYRISEVEKWKRNAEDPMFSGRIDTWQAACGIARGDRDKARAERDALAAAIRDAAVKARICRPDADLTGPMLTMLCADMAARLAELEGQEPRRAIREERIISTLAQRAKGHPIVLEIMADCADVIDAEYNATHDPEVCPYDGDYWLKSAKELRAEAAKIRSEDPEIWPVLSYARPIPAEPPLPAVRPGWRDINDVIADREKDPKKKAALDRARKRLAAAVAEPVNAQLLEALRRCKLQMSLKDLQFCRAAIAAAEDEQRHGHEAQQDHDELTRAARAVVERWDSPLWKDLPHTAEYIDALRRALAATPAMPPTPCQDHAAQQEIDEHYEALEREHMGDPDKQTGIYQPDVIAAVRQREAEKLVSLRGCNSNHGRPDRSVGHQCLYRMRSTDPACTGCIDRGEG